MNLSILQSLQKRETELYIYCSVENTSTGSTLKYSGWITPDVAERIFAVLTENGEVNIKDSQKQNELEKSQVTLLGSMWETKT